ncbi:MAG: hypothetical protein EXX96DRAFT_589646 [Benjaminiella poitrasii]|nr:MAG: hypothetical protein EXX96DRAFT_589646 [Benjaminiella poitrasii]
MRDKRILDVLVKLDGMELLLQKIEELIHAIEIKNSTLLQELSRIPSDEFDLKYFQTLFTAIFMYNYISDIEHEIVARLRMSKLNEAEGMSVLVIPEVITQSIEDDIFMTDTFTEMYCQTKSTIKKLGYNYTPIIAIEGLGFPVSMHNMVMDVVNQGKL